LSKFTATDVVADNGHDSTFKFLLWVSITVETMRRATVRGGQRGFGGGREEHSTWRNVT